MTKRNGVLSRTIHRSYLGLPPALRAALPRDLRGQVRDWLGLGRAGGKRAPARMEEEDEAVAAALGAVEGRADQAAADPAALEDRLWAGFAASALIELEALAGSRGAPRLAGVSKSRQAEAAFALARWQAARGDFPRALVHLARLRALDPGKAAGGRALLLESDCLRRAGEGAAARRLLAPALARQPDDPDLCLAMANSHLVPGTAPSPERDAIRLDWVNRIYRARGLAELALRDPGRGLAIDNLTAAAPPEPWTGAMPKVSVIMPAWRAEATIAFALESLLAQSWTNLEILVVDDASPDGTAAVAEAVAARDPRVRVIRQPENRGGYAARNRGWLDSTGDFITTHDTDDWSHPEKIARQMRYLRDHPEAPACFSDWVRASPELGFGWLFRAWSRFSGKSMSSILIPRPLMERLGGWDVVRVGGDTEILRRIQAIAGDPGLSPQAEKGVPLAFALHAETSLTRQSATQVRTLLYGARRDYAEASDFWRAGQAAKLATDPRALWLDPEAGPASPRPFPAPLAVLGRDAETRNFDLLVVSDFAMRGGSFVSTLNTIEAALRAGMRVGVFHWRRHDLNVMKPLDPRLSALAQAGRLAVVSAGEKVRAETVIFGYPVILGQVPDPMPLIDCSEVIVVVNQMAARMIDGADPQYDPEELRATLRGLFGIEGIWAPISGLVSRLMRADPRYPTPSEEIWVPLIDSAAWCAKPPRWRGAAGAAPVLGRHARDNYTKWPRTAEALGAAYCAGQPCVVELMGGAARARDVLGAYPSNWVVHPFDAMDSHDFLDRLDFFLHYPHETYVEEFGRAVLEALARGLPAVLPPVFRETFGAAAVYAEPERVWPTVAALWADEAAYLAQAARGQEFVRAMSDWDRFPARLRRTRAGQEAAALTAAER